MPANTKKDRERLIQLQMELAAVLAQEDDLNSRLEKELTEELAYEARQSFKAFVVQAWSLIDPASEFQDSWFIGMICDHLEAVQRKELLNLIIQIPPRMSKSSLCSALFPAWSWLQDPSEMFITASATQKLVLRDAGRSRRLITSDWYKSTFAPDFELLKDSNQQGKYDNNKGGSRLATSVGGTLTGFGYSVGILDDVLKADDMLSKTKIETTLEWYRQVLKSRRNSAEARTIIIMQRLHMNDPIGWELANNEELWDNLCLPMIYEPGRKFYSSLGWSDIRKTEGELLCPERFSQKEIDRKRKDMGPFGFAAQYQQNPVPKEGGIIKKADIRYYHKLFNKFDFAKFRLIIGSWDLTFTSSGQSYNVGQVWGLKGNNYYLLEEYRDRMDFGKQIKAIKQMKSDFPAIRYMLVEKRANGDAVLQHLQKEIPGLIAVNPQEIGGGDKEVRLVLCSPSFEAGNVYVPHESIAPWIKDVIQEWITFPKAEHSDRVDSLSQALNWLSSKGGMSSVSVVAAMEDIEKYVKEYEQDKLDALIQKRRSDANSVGFAAPSNQSIKSLKSIFG